MIDFYCIYTHFVPLGEMRRSSQTNVERAVGKDVILKGEVERRRAIVSNVRTNSAAKRAARVNKEEAVSILSTFSSMGAGTTMLTARNPLQTKINKRQGEEKRRLKGRGRVWGEGFDRQRRKTVTRGRKRC